MTNFSSQLVLMLSGPQPISFGYLNKSLLLYWLGLMLSSFIEPDIFGAQTWEGMAGGLEASQWNP